MNRILGVILVLAVFSCKNFETKKVSSEKIVQNELKQIDWKSLDTYPSFAACDTFSNKIVRKHCFEQEFSKHIYQVLGKHEVILKDSIHQKINLTIGISAKGKPELEKAQIPEEVKVQIPEIRKWLKEAVSTSPKIYPAEKRGIPVAVKFKLPVVIQSN